MSTDPKTGEFWTTNRRAGFGNGSIGLGGSLGFEVIQRWLIGTSEKTAAKFEVRRRLSGYWRMELFAALLIPLSTIFLLLVFQVAFGMLLVGCFVPMCGAHGRGRALLRAKVAAIDGDHTQLAAVIFKCRILKLPALILTSLSLAFVVADWLGLMDIGEAQRSGTLRFSCSLLAAAEYLNYYHRQLQHFDHLPDFLRLVRGKGLRRSHLAKDLKPILRTPEGEKSP